MCHSLSFFKGFSQKTASLAIPTNVCQSLRLFPLSPMFVQPKNLHNQLINAPSPFSASPQTLFWPLFMHHTPSLCPSRRDWVTNTQASVVHLSRLFHSPSVMPSYCICGFKSPLTLCWPLPSSGQNRKRKQTGISGGSCLPPCFSVAGEGL